MSCRSGVFALALSLLWTGSAAAQGFTFVAIGDLPDNVPREASRLDRLTAEINRLAPDFTFHLGDITNGGVPCSDETFARVALYFARFEQPLIYTPGDNEWVDYYRPGNGRFDPQERLARLREVFFASAQSHGKRRLAYARQGVDPRYAKFVENASFAHNGIQFATLHIVGSNNNFQRTRAQAAEHAERNAANIAWTRKAFADAKATAAKALVLAMHADPMFEEIVPERRSGFNSWLDALSEETVAFRRPVLLVHGDGHRFRVDMPLRVGPEQKLVRNFLRVEGFGEPEVGAVVVTVDPSAAMPFQFRTLLPLDPLQEARDPMALDFYAD